MACEGLSGEEHEASPSLLGHKWWNVPFSELWRYWTALITAQQTMWQAKAFEVEAGRAYQTSHIDLLQHLTWPSPQGRVLSLEGTGSQHHSMAGGGSDLWRWSPSRLPKEGHARTHPGGF